MTRQRYSLTESINRILRSWIGVYIGSDQPGTIPGDIISVEDACSDLAEVFEGSMPGESGILPPGIAVPVANLPNSSTAARGIIETATNAEAVAGVDTARAVTPAGTRAAIAAIAGDEYGGIYTSTGTVTLINLPANTYIKISGSFHVDMESTANMTPDWNDDLIIINEVGLFKIGYDLSYSGLGAAVYTIMPFVDGVAVQQAKSIRTLDAAGAVDGQSGGGWYLITGTPVNIDLRVSLSVSGTLKLDAGQLRVEKLSD